MKSYLKIDYLCKDIAIIHANICGDGNSYIKMAKRSPSNVKKGRTERYAVHILEYTNTCETLLDRFEEIIKRIAPQTYVYRGRQRIQIRNKLLFEFIKKLGAGKSLEWKIPQEIINDSSLRRVWLAAFFDDEGSITESAIVYYSSNKNSLEDVKKMLELEGIECTFYSRYLKNSTNPGYILRIRNRSHKTFLQKIPFIHPKKRLAYQKYWTK
ncbi:MAG: LAGLIDADG family homing endonuclease [Candidatus Woesearchaeota archaeon]